MFKNWSGHIYCVNVCGSDIYFVGGFGTVAWVDVKEYEAIEPDKIAVDGGEQGLKVYSLLWINCYCVLCCDVCRYIG